ncbi:hypothetical protein [uncultured Gilliamella sp.]|jgi:hypothetical protein|uniref:hypothetical protein n=1 Tax=uncultured Gilliamella sp. TaxID=1193505 RepID=UPI0025D226A5|nr:hypothetical protein [uncultured Gilliamella sp.]
MPSIESKLKMINNFQKEKNELQIKLNEIDHKLKTTIEEICLNSSKENNNKFNSFYVFLLSQIRDLNTCFVFFSIITTSTLFVITKKNFNNNILSFSCLIGLIPFLLMIIDNIFKIKKIKYKIFQMVGFLILIMVYFLAMIYIGISLYNSVDIVNKIIAPLT